MKRIFLYIVVASVAFASCKKDKSVFSETPDERVTKLLNSYLDTIAGASYGWKGFIYPGGLNGGAVVFYFKFNKSNRVQMFSDFDSLSNVTMKESSYRLRALQKPVLVFDTYSYVSVLADPDAAANGGQYGIGLTSDFEFEIDSVTPDSVKLTGRLHSTKAYLVKASKQEMDDYYNQKHSNRAFDNIAKYLVYFKRFTLSGITYEVLADVPGRTVIITWVDGNGTHRFVTSYYYSISGITFFTPLVNGSTIINGFDNITWNGSILSLTVNGVSQTLAPFGRPLANAVNEAVRWKNLPLSDGGVWISQQGFHVNGVDDALGIRTVSNFYYMSYEPGGGVNYDILGIYQVINNALNLNYAPGYLPVSTFADGRTVFNFSRNLGTISQADSLIIDKTRLQMNAGTGYYFVQIDSSTYDMVNSPDGKAWIRWYYN